jgi:hypothetical protein
MSHHPLTQPRANSSVPQTFRTVLEFAREFYRLVGLQPDSRGLTLVDRPRAFSELPNELPRVPAAGWLFSGCYWIPPPASSSLFAGLASCNLDRSSSPSFCHCFHPRLVPIQDHPIPSSHRFVLHPFRAVDRRLPLPTATS